MNEPPSHELVRQLTELQLCHPSDLRRAKGRVRRLSFDLPAFDSVWIDSLVQLRLLTPYQAKRLEQGNADQLRIGPFVVIDEIGRGHHSATYLAQRLNRRDRCVVKCQQVEPDRMDAVARRMAIVLERSRGFAHPQLVMPTESLPSNTNELVTVSRFVPGLPLNELLVRRGRFPAAVVFEIGRQLMDGLAALHAKSLVHGDIRMSNVRLTDHGLAVLVDGGIRPVIHPEITIHDTMALEAYDGMSPELIGTGASASASSELYAVGCLLWQLLAGRPPFTTADPLAKLAAHQTQTISDVRMWAPDTPVMLAETIRQMTSPSPDQRPRSFEEVLQRWGRPGSFSRSRLKQFRRLFDRDVPHFAGPMIQDRFSNKIWVAALLFAMTGAVAVFYESGLRNELLEIVQQVKTFAREKYERTAVPANTTIVDPQVTPTGSSAATGEPLAMPTPSADGVIFLSEHGPYQATQVNFNGDLKIRGALGVKPEIIVDDVALSFTARSVLLEQVTVRHLHENEPVMRVMARCQRLEISNCEFPAARGDADGSRASSPRGVASVAWAPLESDSTSGSIEIKNTSFHGAGAAILLAQTPKSLRVLNTLKTGSGALVSPRPKCSAREMKLVFDHVTLRETGPLLKLSGDFASQTGIAPIQIEANHSVFKIAEPSSGLIVIESERVRPDVAKSVAMTADDSVVVPGTTILMAIDPLRQSANEVDLDEPFDGLSANGIEFAGANLDRIVESKTAGLKGARLDAAEMPGIDPIQIGPANRTAALPR